MSDHLHLPSKALGWVDAALVEDRINGVVEEFADDGRGAFQRHRVPR